MREVQRNKEGGREENGECMCVREIRVLVFDKVAGDRFIAERTATSDAFVLPSSARRRRTPDKRRADGRKTRTKRPSNN